MLRLWFGCTAVYTRGADVDRHQTLVPFRPLQGCSRQLACLGPLGGEEGVVLEAGEAKVTDLGAAVRREQDIVGLEVT